MRRHIILDQGGKEGLRDAESDRSGGEVDIVNILGARRIALRPLETAEILEVLQRLVAGQILDRMEYRRSVRFDRHPVLRS